MSIRIERATGAELEDWNSYVDRSDHASPFHRRKPLALIGRHHELTVHPLVGYKGEHPIGLFPVFETKRGPFTIVTSPPPNTEVTYLGPIRVASTDRKQRKLEKERRRFVEGAIEWIDTEVEPDLVQIRCVAGFTDVRPFLWHDFDVVPSYTYVVDLQRDPDDLFKSFTADVRKNVRNFEETDCEIRVGEADVLEPLNELIQSQLREKGVAYHVSVAHLTDLYEAFGRERMKPYVCTLDGELVGGLIVLKEGDTLLNWVGGVEPTVDVPVNDAITWRIIQDGIDQGAKRYDLHGAMERGISEFKSKFDPELTPLFEVTRKSAGAKAASGLIQQMPESIQSRVP